MKLSVNSRLFLTIAVASVFIIFLKIIGPGEKTLEIYTINHTSTEYRINCVIDNLDTVVIYSDNLSHLVPDTSIYILNTGRIHSIEISANGFESYSNSFIGNVNKSCEVSIFENRAIINSVDSVVSREFSVDLW